MSQGSLVLTEILKSVNGVIFFSMKEEMKYMCAEVAIRLYVTSKTLGCRCTPYNDVLSDINIWLIFPSIVSK